MIDNLPNSWKIEELNKCGKIITGKTPSKRIEEYWNSDDISFIKPDDFDKNRIIYFERGKDFISKKGFEKAVKIPPNSILTTCIGNIGNVLINKCEATINQQINAIVPNENINYKYLAFAIKKIKPIMVDRANAPVVPIINKTDFGKFSIPIPPLQQQEKIVKVLDLTSNLIEKQKELLEKYDLFLKSKFIEMFGDPIKNPMGWEVVPFSKLANIKTKSIKAENISNEIYIGLDCIEKDTSKLLFKYDAEKEEIKSNKYIFTSEMILYGKLRPYLNKVLLPSFSGICSTDILPIEPIRNKSTKEYLAYFLKDKNTVELLSNSVSGANLPRVSPQILKDLKIFEIPFELQNKFASIVEKIETIKEKENQKLKQMNDLHNSMMQKAFKGEII